MSSELPPAGAEFANGKMLSQLYRVASCWLIDNGEYISGSPDECAPTWFFQDLPVLEDPDLFEVVISGDTIRDVCPDAARDLNVGKQVRISYWVPHSLWNDVTEQFEVQQPEVKFNIMPPESSAYSGVSFSVTEIAPETFSGQVSRSPRPLSDDKHVQDVVGGLGRLTAELEAITLEQRTGIDRVTRVECEALNAVADNLHRLVG